ncbi:MAG: hypothetical protein H6625_12480 [Bdellovibrionaceae bacterium]|nr:hypothetical protein [Pseudobdellovibrionaceae bacterium]
MKALLLITTLFMYMAPSLKANAACIPHGVAESEVSGRTYVLENSPNPEYPIYLTFGDSSDLTAGYGSALDGHPGGEYHYRGNCHGEIIVTFTSYFGSNPEPKEVLHLRPTDSEYFLLRSVYDVETVFKIVID